MAKIFIDREPGTGDFLMRLPEEALADLYEMIKTAPLAQRRTFFTVRQHLEQNYPELITPRRPVDPVDIDEYGLH